MHLLHHTNRVGTIWKPLSSASVQTKQYTFIVNLTSSVPSSLQFRHLSHPFPSRNIGQNIRRSLSVSTHWNVHVVPCDTAT
jgi:hypothetical protein